VAALIDKTPAPHLADFIDTVGKLIAAVFDMDGGVAVGNVAAVHVSNA
jgi:hypothetical protein